MFVEDNKIDVFLLTMNVCMVISLVKESFNIIHFFYNSIFVGDLKVEADNLETNEHLVAKFLHGRVV